MSDILSRPALWAIASFAIYLASAFLRRWMSATSQPRLIALGRGWQEWHIAPVVVTGVQLLYYIGIPYVAIIEGSIDLRTFGLIGADLPAALLVGAGVGLAAWAILATAWRRLLPPIHANTHPPSAQPGLGESWSIPLDTICAQAHWALYRSWAVLLWGTYVGVFVGLALAAAEWLAGHVLSHGWLRPTDLAWERGLTHLALAWVAALVFLAGNSLWACLLVHAGLLWALRAYLQPASAQDTDMANNAP